MTSKIKLKTLHLDDKTAYIHVNYQGRMYSDVRFFMVYIADKKNNDVFYRGLNGHYVFSEEDTRILLRENSVKSQLIIEELAWKRHYREVNWR